MQKNTTQNWQPANYHTIDSYIPVKGAADFIEFLKKAFDAKEDIRVLNPDGTIGHAEVRVGDSVLLMFDSNDNWPDTPAFLRIYVEDADASFKRVIGAGAESITEVMDSFLGERGGRVKDPFGNIWWIITRVEDLSDEEKGQRAGEQIYLDNMAIAIKTFDEEMRSRKS
ncbi:MAG TPA: VOC family protein [Anaerolineales bacterium]|nr:VOC family protein [Anaerolineales bacterium]